MSRFPELERAVLARKGQRSGDEVWFRCPFPESHKNGDARPSAKFNVAKGVWICTVCKQHGGAKHLSNLLGLTAGSSREIAATYPYTDEEGQPLFEVVRYANPKTFRQRRPDGKGGWIWKMKDVRRVLYRLPEVLAAVEAGQPIHVVEGEKDADSLAALGLVATTSAGGAGKWRKEYTTSLQGARVVIVPDNDRPGRDHARLVAGKLEGVADEILVVALPDLREGGDISDWIAARKGAGLGAEEMRQELERVIAEAPPWEPADESDPEEEGEGSRPTQSQILLRLVETAGVELFHDPDREAFARIPVEEHHELWPVRSRDFRDWLAERYYSETGRAPSAQPRQDALNTLEARARFAGDEHDVFTRVAGVGSAVYVDLCNARWEAVEVTAAGWRVVAEPPVRCRRTPSMRPLPEPARGGSLSDLRPFVNLPDERMFVLLVAFLVAALGPQGPFPVLVLNGEQGSAKSTLARLVASLVDPSAAALLTLPRTEHDLMITASHRRLLVFDNLSGLPGWFSDALCRLSTGGGFAVRELYTDRHEVVFAAMRPVVLNGIDEVIGRQDLIDRSLVLSLPAISEEDRRPERELWAEIDALRPRLFGALLDAVSCGLRRRGEVRLERTPRMADFAHWVVAAEPALPWAEGTFLAGYEANRGEAVAASLEADEVASEVRDLISEAPFEGTVTELLTALDARVPETTRKARTWPKTTQALSSRLRRVAPSLRRSGVEFTSGLREAGTGRRLIRLAETNTAEERHGRHGRHKAPQDGASRRDKPPQSVTGDNGACHTETAQIPGRRDECDDRDESIPADSESGEEDVLRL